MIRRGLPPRVWAVYIYTGLWNCLLITDNLIEPSMHQQHRKTFPYHYNTAHFLSVEMCTAENTYII